MMKKHIPNFITSLNLASGFISVIFAINEMYDVASWLILAAMVFDFLDGFSARLLKAYSEIGKELDSLADVVSFGVAPAVILYQVISDSLAAGVPSLSGGPVSNSVFIHLVTVLMPVCAALRLAKFNIDTTQAVTFKGLPTPANALAVISLVLAAHYSDSRLVAGITGSLTIMVLFTVVLSILMVTRIPLLSLKTSHLRFRGNEGRYVLILSLVPVIVIFGFAGAIFIIPLYILVSLISLSMRQNR